MNLSSLGSGIGSGGAFKDFQKGKTVVLSPPPTKTDSTVNTSPSVSAPIKKETSISNNIPKITQEIPKDTYFEIKTDKKKIKAQGEGWMASQLIDFKLTPQEVIQKTPNAYPPPMVQPLVSAPPPYSPMSTMLIVQDTKQIIPRLNTMNGYTVDTKPIESMQIDSITHGTDDFIQTRINDGPCICMSLNCKQFSVLLREGLTSGMSSRIYLQKGVHNFTIPVTLAFAPRKQLYLDVQCIYQGKMIKDWRFPIVADESLGMIAHCDMDFEEKWYLQKRLYHIDFICEDLKVSSPEFSIVNVQQFVKTKKRKFTISKWTFLGIHPAKGSSKGGDFIAMYFNEPFASTDRIFLDQQEVRSIFSGFNATSHFPAAKYCAMIETPPHKPEQFVHLTVLSGRNQLSHAFTFE